MEDLPLKHMPFIPAASQVCPLFKSSHKSNQVKNEQKHFESKIEIQAKDFELLVALESTTRESGPPFESLAA